MSPLWDVALIATAFIFGGPIVGAVVLMGCLIHWGRQ